MIRHVAIGGASRLALIGVIAVVTAGCASSGQLLAQEPMSKPPASRSTILVEVVPFDPDAREHVNAITMAIENKLFGEGFRPTRGKDSQDLVLRVEVTELRPVSESKRLWLGAFAGQATIRANVVVEGAGASEVVGRFTAEGKSSGGNIFAGTTEQAMDELAAQIAIYLQGDAIGH
jgi:hypothetical protein